MRTQIYPFSDGYFKIFLVFSLNNALLGVLFSKVTESDLYGTCGIIFGL
jgi:hypothetical protein